MRFNVTSPLARKISPLMNGYCFSKSSSSGLDSLTLVEAYQMSLPSFFAPSTSFALSSPWLHAADPPKHKAITSNADALTALMTGLLLSEKRPVAYRDLEKPYEV